MSQNLPNFGWVHQKEVSALKSKCDSLLMYVNIKPQNTI